MTRPNDRPQSRTPLSAEVLRKAAERPHAPHRLLRAADAVLDGKFTWEDVADGRCEHPFARSLFTPKAHETMWPLLREVADELQKPPARAPVRPHVSDDEEEDLSLRTYREDSFIPRNRW
jgi:hypothetical protein